MGKHAKSIDSQILQRVKAVGRGRVFTPRDFLDLGSRDAVDKALSRHAQSGTIRKLARGLYDYPRQDPQFGLLSPSITCVMPMSDARRPHWKLARQLATCSRNGGATAA